MIRRLKYYFEFVLFKWRGGWLLDIAPKIGKLGWKAIFCDVRCRDCGKKHRLYGSNAFNLHTVIVDHDPNTPHLYAWLESEADGVPIVEMAELFDDFYHADPEYLTHCECGSSLRTAVSELGGKLNWETVGKRLYE